jgi:hypothetical protein
VQKLAQQFAGVGIAPPKPVAQKTLQFNTPNKGSHEVRVVLGELRVNPMVSDGDGYNQDASAFENIKSNSKISSSQELSACQLSLKDDCTEMISAISDVVDTIDPSNVPAQDLITLSPSEESCPQLLGHNLDGFMEIAGFKDNLIWKQDCVEESGNETCAVETVMPNDKISHETEDTGIEHAQDKETQVIEHPFESSMQTLDSKELVSNSIHEESDENPEGLADENALRVVQLSSIECNMVELVPCIDGFVDDAPGGVRNHVLETATLERIDFVQELAFAKEFNSSIQTAPDDTAYDAAVDDDVNQQIQQEILVLEVSAVEDYQTQAVHVCNDERSQAVTVTEMSMQMQEHVMAQKPETSPETSNILGSSILVSTEHEEFCKLAPEPAPSLHDPLEVSTPERFSAICLQVSKKRESSPVEDHLKLVVKSTVLQYCTEVQEENFALHAKIESLEAQILKHNKQLAVTNAQLSACATKEQINQLQDLLIEAASHRHAHNASCKGCTIC